VTTATHDVLWVSPIHYPIYVPPRPVLPAGEPAHPPGVAARRVAARTGLGHPYAANAIRDDIWAKV
jgi:hypothetical protein